VNITTCLFFAFGLFVCDTRPIELFAIWLESFSLLCNHLVFITINMITEVWGQGDFGDIVDQSSNKVCTNAFGPS